MGGLLKMADHFRGNTRHHCTIQWVIGQKSSLIVKQHCITLRKPQMRTFFFKEHLWIILSSCDDVTANLWVCAFDCIALKLHSKSWVCQSWVQTVMHLLSHHMQRHVHLTIYLQSDNDCQVDKMESQITCHSATYKWLKMIRSFHSHVQLAKHFQMLLQSTEIKTSQTVKTDTKPDTSMYQYVQHLSMLTGDACMHHLLLV